MEFYIPTHIYNEKNCVRNHSRELAALGTKALIVTGKHSSSANGSLEDARSALKREKIPCVVFNEIEENPSVDTVMKASRFGTGQGADFVIGVGGGSPMDAAKAVALLMANPDREADLLYSRPGAGEEGSARPALPVAEIPTTAGTGSEVTPYAILTRRCLPEIMLTTQPVRSGGSPVESSLKNTVRNTKQSISHRIFPALALIDITYLQTVSRDGCIHTAVDTLAHLVESHLNTNADDYSRTFSEMGLRVFAQVKDRLLLYEIGSEERRKLMYACTLGGMAIAHTGTSLPHGLSYPVTCEMGIPHGKAAGIFLPGFFRNYGDREEAMKTLGLLEFGSVQSFSEYIRALLGEVQLPDALWEMAVEEVMDNPAKLRNYPFMMDRERLARFR